MEREEFFAKQKKYATTRRKQVANLIKVLDQKIGLKGNKIISIGCGTATELELIKFSEKIGVDTNSSIIDYCNEHVDANFVCGNYMTYLDTMEGSTDVIIALDIDTNIMPLQLVRLAMRKLRKNGKLIITERENNQQIYGRLLLKPHFEQLKMMTTKIREYHQSTNGPIEWERDNYIIVIEK